MRLCRRRLRRGVEDFVADDIARPALCLLIDAPDILSQNSRTYQLYSADQQDGQDSRREALYVGCSHPKNWDVKGPHYQHEQQHEERNNGHGNSNQKYGRQWRSRKIEDAIVGQLDQFTQWVFGGAGGASLALVSDAGLTKAGPRPETAKEPVFLRQLIDNFQHLAVDQREVSGIGRRVDARQPLKNLIKNLVPSAFEKRLLTFRAD